MTEEYFVDVDFYSYKPLTLEGMENALEDLETYSAAGSLSLDGMEGSISLTVRTADREEAKNEARRVVGRTVLYWSPEGSIVTTQASAVLSDLEVSESIGDWFDPIDHPAHYNSYPVEVIDLAEHMPFNRGNVIKYVARAGLKSKDTELEDLKKAQWYLDREIDRITR